MVACNAKKSIVWITEGGRENPASRLRAFEVADMLEKIAGVENIFPPFKLSAPPTTVFLQKVCAKKELELVRRLKSCGTRFVFDLCDPIWLQDDINRQREWDVDQAVALADLVTVPAAALQAAVKTRYPGARVMVIPDAVDLEKPEFTDIRRHDADSAPRFLRIGWISTSLNLQYLSMVADDLRGLAAQHDIILRVISTPHCEMLPPVPWVPVEFIPWQLDTYARHLRECDIALLALPLDNWNSGKSANRLQLCLALGVPVVFSPLPSYLEFLADAPELGQFAAAAPGEWRTKIAMLMDPAVRDRLAGIGRRLVERKGQLKHTVSLWHQAVFG